MGHRAFEKPKETSFAPCWPKVNWLTFPWTGRNWRESTCSAHRKGRAVLMLGWTKWAIAIAAAGLAMCGAAPVRAGDTTVAVQRLGPPQIEARRDALLKQMIARPNDLDLAFEYATLSSQVGDYEGAISTLERMLIYAPNTPRLQLELGMLYYKPRRLRRGPRLFRAGAGQSERAALGGRADPSLSPATRPCRRSAALFRHDLFRRSAGRATPMPDPARKA